MLKRSLFILILTLLAAPVFGDAVQLYTFDVRRSQWGNQLSQTDTVDIQAGHSYVYFALNINTYADVTVADIDIYIPKPLRVSAIRYHRCNAFSQAIEHALWKSSGSHHVYYIQYATLRKKRAWEAGCHIGAVLYIEIQLTGTLRAQQVVKLQEMDGFTRLRELRYVVIGEGAELTTTRNRRTTDPNINVYYQFDVDGDGHYGTSDVKRLRSLIASNTYATDYDFNIDGTLDEDDVSRLKAEIKRRVAAAAPRLPFMRKLATLWARLKQ